MGKCKKNTISDPIGKPMPSVTLSNKECNCIKHATIVTAKTTTVCQYDEINLPVFPNPQGDWHIKGEPEPVPIRVMEEDGFWIEKCEKNKIYDQHESYVAHFCPHTQWKNFLDEEHMMKYGLCFHCHQTVPPGIIALWQMHNWEYLQTGVGQSNFPEASAST